jgi:hypothetical protein
LDLKKWSEWTQLFQSKTITVTGVFPVGPIAGMRRRNSLFQSPQPSDIMSDILFLFTVPQPAESGDRPFQNYISAIPTFDRQLIVKVASGIGDTRSITESLVPIIHYFPYNGALFRRFMQDFADKKPPMALIAVPLMAFIHWMGQEDLSGIAQFFPEILDLALSLASQSVILSDFCFSAAVNHFLESAHGRFPSDLVRRFFKSCKASTFDAAVSVLNSTFLNRDVENARFLMEVRKHCSISRRVCEV